MIGEIGGVDLDPQYEWLRKSVSELAASPQGGTREVKWFGESHLLGAARTRDGAVELFIAGDALEARHPAVRDVLEHNAWVAGDGATVPANRLKFPSAPYYDQVAAFVCAELLEAGLEAERNAAFQETEPVIALAMRRASMGNSSLLGFAGELLFLRSLIWSVPAAASPGIITAWKGSGRSTRDFQFGAVGVEVKTTTRTSARHHIQGVHQLELGESVDGEPEHSLYLLSLGITWLANGGESGYSIADLAQSALDRLPDGESRKALIEAMKAYGVDAQAGYDHARHAKLDSFSRRFALQWARLYDPTDPRLLLLDAKALEPFVHVVSSSVAFDVELPEKVNGDANPVVGLPEATARVLHMASL